MISFEQFKLLFSGPLVRNALIVGILLSVTAALLGVSLVLKKYSMIGDGLSHVSFGAMAVAVAMGKAPLAFALPVVIVAAFLLLRVSEKSRVKGDAAVAVVSTASLAVGAIASRGMNVDIEGFMFGSIVSVTASDVILTVTVTLLTLLLYVLCYHRIFAVTFDETYTKATGGKPALYNAMIAVMTAVTVVVGMRLVGSLLISALVIFPALSSMRLFKSFRAVVLSSGVISVVTFILALFVSILFDISTSACIVLLDLSVFGIATLTGTVKKA